MADAKQFVQKVARRYILMVSSKSKLQIISMKCCMSVMLDNGGPLLLYIFTRKLNCKIVELCIYILFRFTFFKCNLRRRSKSNSGSSISKLFSVDSRHSIDDEINKKSKSNRNPICLTGKFFIK